MITTSQIQAYISLMRHKDVDTVVDWLYSITPHQTLQPIQIQSFHKLFCLKDDIIVMGITSFRRNHFGATYFIARRFLHRSFWRQFDAL